MPREDWITDDGADRIIAAVGEKLQSDKQGLIRCLNLCGEWYRSAVAFSSNKPEKDLARRLAMISKTARRLNQLLASEAIQQSLFMSIPAEEFPRAALDGAAQLVVMADRCLNRIPHGPSKSYRRSFKRRSPFEWLVGNFLPDVFELNFQRAASAYENGAFIRFAESVVTEAKIAKAGKSYSRASIAKALRNERAGLVRRRRSVPVRDDEYRWWRRALLTTAAFGDASRGL
jgi:hypothetical protein